VDRAPYVHVWWAHFGDMAGYCQMAIILSQEAKPDSISMKNLRDSLKKAQLFKYIRYKKHIIKF
jgi:hypothetical protein